MKLLCVLHGHKQMDIGGVIDAHVCLMLVVPPSHICSVSACSTEEETLSAGLQHRNDLDMDDIRASEVVHEILYAIQLVRVPMGHIHLEGKEKAPHSTR